jgi:hypothetical protein
MTKPHPNDGVTVDDLPNIVVDEEGFHVAAFRFYTDAKQFVETSNALTAMGHYCIEGEQ